MAGLTDTTAQANLTSLVAAYPFIALFTAAGVDAGTGFTEVSGGSYARVTSTWGAASGSSPSQISNNLVTFAQATASWGNVIAVGGFTLVSGGVLGWWDYLGAYDWRPFTCTSASPGVINCPGSVSAWTLANADNVVVDAEFGGALPTLSAGSWTGLQTVAGLSGDTFNVALNTTTTGGGLIRKVSTVNPSTGVTFSIPAGQLILKAA